MATDQPTDATAARVRERVQAVLKKYGQHLNDGNGGCGARTNPFVWPCTCGLSAALGEQR